MITLRWLSQCSRAGEHACMHTYIYIYTHIHKCRRMHTRKYVLRYIKIYSEVCILLASMNMYVCMYVFMHVCMYLCMYVCMYVADVTRVFPKKAVDLLDFDEGLSSSSNSSAPSSTTGWAYEWLLLSFASERMYVCMYVTVFLNNMKISSKRAICQSIYSYIHTVALEDALSALADLIESREKILLDLKTLIGKNHLAAINDCLQVQWMYVRTMYVCMYVCMYDL